MRRSVRKAMWWGVLIAFATTAVVTADAQNEEKEKPPAKSGVPGGGVQVGGAPMGGQAGMT
jgi:hypothetical protein